MVILFGMIGTAQATDIYTSLFTNGKVNSYTDIHTDDNVYVYVDGVNMTNIPEYIDENEEKWSIDKVGMSLRGLIYHIRSGINWMLGIKDDATDDEKQLIYELDRGFASQYEIEQLKYNQEILLVRIESLEKTLEKTNLESFCEGKKEIAEKYNITGFTCGNTTYRKTDKGYLGITPL